MASGISGRNQFSFRFSSPQWSSAMKIFKAAGRRLKTCGLAVIASDPDKRAALAAAMDGFEQDFLDDFYWAIGLQSPHMLHALMMALNWACRPKDQSKPRPVFRLVDRKKNGH
jgi:hypothetical protein